MPTHKSVWSVNTDATAPRFPGTTADLGSSTKTRPFLAECALTSVHVTFEGAPVGTPAVFASDDHDPEDMSDPWNGKWEDIAALLPVALAAAAGAPISWLIDLSGIRARAFYFGYTRSSGTGTGRAKWSKEAR